MAKRDFFFRGYSCRGREADHVLPTNVQVKNMWSYTSTPSCLYGLHRDIFILLLLPIALQPSVGFGFIKQVIPSLPIQRQFFPIFTSITFISLHTSPSHNILVFLPFGSPLVSILTFFLPSLSPFFECGLAI